MSNEEMAELRYQETMDAIGIWLDDNKGKGSRAEAIGIAKAFLTHASMAIVISLPGCDESDAQRLMKRLCARKRLSHRTGPSLVT